MNEHVEASLSEQSQELSQHTVSAQARRVDASVPRIDPKSEANLPKDHKDDREDSILPEEAQGFLDKLGRGVRRWRGATLDALPAAVVNNSTNFIGAGQLAGEVLMIKAYSPLRTAEDIAAMEGKNRTVEEIKLFAKGIPGSLPLRMSFSDLFNPEFHKANFRALKDLSYAAERDLAYGRISNRWGMRSTMLGMSGMAVAAILPEKPEPREEIEQMAQLRQDNYLGYMGARLSQAVNPLGWSSHKRQVAGLGITGAGVCSFMNGMMSATSGAYTRNRAHAFAGAITAAAGSMTMLAPDDEQGWQNFGKIMSMRILLLPNSLLGKFQNKQDGRYWYTGGQAVFRGNDALAYMIGGAEKLPDGTIVDKQAIRKQAEAKAKGINTDTIFDEEETVTEETQRTKAPNSQVSEIKEHKRQSELPQQGVAHV